MSPVQFTKAMERTNPTEVQPTDPALSTHILPLEKRLCDFFLKFYSSSFCDKTPINRKGTQKQVSDQDISRTILTTRGSID